MKIILYGGSFNPFHKGHMEVANILNEYADEVWILPCKNHPFNKILASEKDRMSMIKLAIELNKNDKIKLSNFDIDNQHNGTYEMLENISYNYPNLKFSFAIGEDCAEQIKKWKNVDKLLDKYEFTVIKREGYLSTDNWFKHGNHVYIDEKIKNFNSTEIRKKIGSHQPVVEIEKDVYDYILKHHLYELGE